MNTWVHIYVHKLEIVGQLTKNILTSLLLIHANVWNSDNEEGKKKPIALIYSEFSVDFEQQKFLHKLDTYLISYGRYVGCSQ